MFWSKYKENFLSPREMLLLLPKKKWKKGELKENKIIIDGLQDHLPDYVGNMKKYKDIYDDLSCIYEVKNLNEIIPLKYKLIDMKKNRG